MTRRHSKDRARYEERRRRRELSKVDAEQAARLAHKEAAKDREVVDCRMRVILPSYAEAIEIEFTATRAQLAMLQAAHNTADGIHINWIQEDKF